PHAAAIAGTAPAVIGDDTPTPAHARFSRPRFVSIVAGVLVVWGTALGILAMAFGWRGDATQMGWFFTQAALVTFGGAYAVLPFVIETAVDGYGWLTAPQMIDGLALGETTPGPLIMIVAFVGFVGGWTRPVLAHVLLSGALVARR